MIEEEAHKLTLKEAEAVQKAVLEERALVIHFLMIGIDSWKGENPTVIGRTSEYIDGGVAAFQAAIQGIQYGIHTPVEDTPEARAFVEDVARLQYPKE